MDDLRDQFAAAALQGLLASGEHHGRRDARGGLVSADAHSLTRDAYALADEMIRARKEGSANG
jgi:hypothetical protein